MVAYPLLGDFGQGHVGVSAPACPVLGTQVQLLSIRGYCQLTNRRRKILPTTWFVDVIKRAVAWPCCKPGMT